MSRSGNACAIFSQDDNWKHHFAGGTQNRKEIRIFLRESGKCVSVQNHFQISLSIFSKAPSMNLLMRFVSLRKCLSLPKCFNQGFSSWAADFNFSSTA